MPTDPSTPLTATSADARHHTTSTTLRAPARSVRRSVRWLIALAALGLVSLGSSSPATATPTQFAPTAVFPDPNGFVVFVNTTRELICTAEQVQYETDVVTWISMHLADYLAWIEAGNDPAQFVPQPPEPPERPAGIELFDRVQRTTAQGAVVQNIRGDDIPIELWVMDEGAPGVGPCLDSASQTLVGTGVADVRAHDNDVFVSGTRTNAFGNTLRAELVDPSGNTFSYSIRFHVNSSCHVPDGEAPVCLIEHFELR
jgi:hypothetical protein